MFNILFDSSKITQYRNIKYQIISKYRSRKAHISSQKRDSSSAHGLPCVHHVTAALPTQDLPRGEPFLWYIHTYHGRALRKCTFIAISWNTPETEYNKNTESLSTPTHTHQSPNVYSTEIGRQRYTAHTSCFDIAHRSFY